MTTNSGCPDLKMKFEVNAVAKKKKAEEAYINSPLNNPMPNYAVYIMGKTESILAFLISFVLGGCTGLIFYVNLFMNDGYPTLATHISNVVVFALVGFLATKFLIPMYIKKCLDKRKNALKQQFRDMLEALASSFSTGSNVQKSFEAAAADLAMQYQPDDHIVLELREILDGTKQNIDLAVMLENFAMRSGNEDIANFANVFSVCYQKGGNMNYVVHRTHSVISEKMAISDEIETKLTSNKLQHNVMSIMPIAVVALLRFTNDAFAANFATVIGVLANTVAIGIFVGAYIYGNKIVDVKG